MAKVNSDGTIEGEMKEVKENEDVTQEEEAKKEDEKKPSKPMTVLKIVGGILGTATIIGLSVFAGTKIKK